VDTPIATDTTDANGDYLFSGLAAGNYIIYIPTPPAAAPLSSSPGVTDSADNNQDNDDNGIQAASGQPVTSPVIALTVDGETSAEPGQGGTQDDFDDNNGNMTVDFGFVPTASLVADPAVAKSGNPVRASVGETVVFTLRVTNIGNAAAANVVVTDPLPAIFDVLSVTSVFQAGGNAGAIAISPGPAPFTVTVTLPNLATTDVVIITITTRVNSRGTPPIVNSAVLSTGGTNRLTSNDVSAANFTVRGTTSNSLYLPSTGFAPNVTTELPSRPVELKYAATDIVIEIPSLGVKMPVVGVPKKNGAWDVTWLGSQAGWLEGSAFPSWNGNSVLTSHVYLSNGLPGPFVNLSKLKYGDKVIIHAYGERYIFEVRTNSVVSPDDATVMKHEERSWITLLTCKDYDEKTNTYRKRVVIRAILVKVEAVK
jgi:LPXTG-site transpeptidase (sortase) family protein